MRYDNIRKYRKDKGITLKQLSDKTGISFSAIAMYERGSAEPSLEKIQRIAEELGVNVEDILGETHKPIPKLSEDLSGTTVFRIIEKQQDTIAKQQDIIDKQQSLESRQQETIAKLIEMLEKKN